MRELNELSLPQRPILWDLDGTIVDTRRDISSGVAGLMRERGLQPLPLDSVVRHVGLGVRNLVARCLEEGGGPVADEGDLDEAVRQFKAHYAVHLLDTTLPYEGLPGILHALAARGRRMAVVTNKPEEPSRTILRALGMLPCFAVVLGGDSLPTRKPAPEPLLHALRICDPAADPHDAILIGDSITDVQSARAAGIPVCGVAWGFDPDGQLRGSEPDWWVETTADLGKALLGEP